MGALRSTSEGPGLLLLWTALAITAAAGTVVGGLEATFFEHNSYYLDPAFYSYENARLHERVRVEGRWRVAVDEWRANGRYPLRTAPIVLLAPSLLASPVGHLATALPVLAAFLFTLGRTVYAATRHLGYSVACMLLFACLPGMFDVIVGLGAFLLDLPAALLVGAAAFCVLRFGETDRLVWLAAFAVLASLAALSRYISAAFVLVSCGPPLAVALFRRWRKRGAMEGIVTPLLLVGAVIAVLAGRFLVTHFDSTRSFYAVYGYALGKGVGEAAAAAQRGLGAYVPPALAAFLAGLAALGLSVLGDRRAGLARGATLLWMALAGLLLQVLVLRSGAHAQVSLYSLPALVAFAVTPLPWTDRFRRSRGPRVLAAAVAAVAVASAAMALRTNVPRARRPASEKVLNTLLAEQLVRRGPRVVWNAFFDESSWLPSLEAFYERGTLPLVAGQDFFTVHRTTWAGEYPGLGPEEVARRVYERACRWLDVIVVFEDPRRAGERFDNAHSRAVARFMAEEAARDPRWRRFFRAYTHPHGGLAGYWNVALEGQNAAYGLRLRNRPLP